MELVRRYSNRADLLERLQRVAVRAGSLGEQAYEDGDTVRGRTPRVWRVRDRLTDDDINGLIADFLAGIPKRVLAEQHGVSFSTVKNILRQHGVRRTGSG